MKKRSNNFITIIVILFLIIFSTTIIYLFYVNISKKNLYASEIENLNMDLGFLNFQQTYLTQLIDVNNIENSKYYSFDSLFFFKMEDEEKKSPKRISQLFRSGKEKLIIRYTEIGCNSCADSTFGFLKNYHNLLDKFETIVFVDFSNYDSYLKWKKISDVSFPVYWVKKGALPFNIEKEFGSYMFTVNSNLEVSNFFIPNSKFPIFIKEYIAALQQK